MSLYWSNPDIILDWAQDRVRSSTIVKGKKILKSEIRGKKALEDSLTQPHCAYSRLEKYYMYLIIKVRTTHSIDYF